MNYYTYDSEGQRIEGTKLAEVIKKDPNYPDIKIGTVVKVEPNTVGTVFIKEYKIQWFLASCLKLKKT